MCDSISHTGHHTDLSIGLKTVQQLDHMWMLQPPQTLDLSLQRRHVIGCPSLLGQEFQCHDATRARTASLEDLNTHRRLPSLPLVLTVPYDPSPTRSSRR